jgi:cytochrome P450
MSLFAPEHDHMPFRDDAYRSNPYPAYDEIRDKGDVYLHPMGIYVVTKHAHISTLLRDRRLSVFQIDFGPAAPLHDSMLGQDPPDHTRLRRATMDWFVPDSVEKWKEFTRSRIREILVYAETRGSIDAVTELAYPLTHSVMCHILDVPFDGSFDVRDKTFDFGLSLGPGANDADLVATENSVIWFDGYIRGLIADKRANPGNGMLDSLISHADSGNMTEAEVIATTFLFFAVGHLDVSYLIENGLRLMAGDAGLRDDYRDNIENRPNVINEILRFDTPEQFVTRQTTEPVVVGDAVIPAGELVMLMIGAANKDPEVFAEPHTFNFRRPATGKGHFAFGGGMHGCPGQILARAVADLVFIEFVTRYPNFRLDGEPEWGHTEFIRALHKLPMALS